MPSDTESYDYSIPRLPTGVKRLDYILKGGLVRGASYSVVGPPGSGKTVLANQICYQHAHHDGRALYVTLLSESHTRMLTHIRGLKFFDPNVIHDRLQYISGYSLLEKEGLSGLLKLVTSSARKHRASLIVIDGVDAAGDFAPSEVSFTKFVHELQAFTQLLDATTLLVGTSGPDVEHPENTAVDGIIELTLRMVGPRAVRELSVQKFRGSDYLLGRHEVEILETGIVVHPRTEVQFASPVPLAEENRIRMPFGVKRLDAMLHGGLLSGSATTLLGAPGSGKTVLGLQFLSHGAELGQPGVYFGFYETPPRLIEKAEAVSIPLKEHVESGLVEIQWQPPLETNLDSLAERLLERIRERNLTGQRLRVFVDGVGGFRAASVYPDRMGRFLSALTHQLRLLDVTTLFAEETPLFKQEIELPTAELGGAVENVILLRNVELRSHLYRLLSVMKMRESAYDTSIREFAISARGISVSDSFNSAEAILSGHARVVSDAAAPAQLKPRKSPPPPKKKKAPARSAKSKRGARR